MGLFKKETPVDKAVDYYFKGKYAKAMKIFEQYAETFEEVQYCLGDAYYKGIPQINLPVDYEKAIYYLEKVVKANHFWRESAVDKLWEIYLNKSSLPNRGELGKPYCKEHHKRRIAKTYGSNVYYRICFEDALKYLKGEEIDLDTNFGLELLDMLLNLYSKEESLGLYEDDIKKAVCLAEDYEKGTVSIPQDQRAAFKLYSIAVKEKNVDAMYHLACMYENGDYVDQDWEKAISLYKQSGEFSYVVSLLRLAQIYLQEPKYKDINIAQEYIDKVLRMDSSLSEEQKAMVHYLNGLYELEIYQTSRSLTELTKARKYFQKVMATGELKKEIQECMEKLDEIFARERRQMQEEQGAFCESDDSLEELLKRETHTEEELRKIANLSLLEAIGMSKKRVFSSEMEAMDASRKAWYKIVRIYAKPKSKVPYAGLEKAFEAALHILYLTLNDFGLECSRTFSESRFYDAQLTRYQIKMLDRIRDALRGDWKALDDFKGWWGDKDVFRPWHKNGKEYYTTGEEKYGFCVLYHVFDLMAIKIKEIWALHGDMEACTQLYKDYRVGSPMIYNRLSKYVNHDLCSIKDEELAQKWGDLALQNEYPPMLYEKSQEFFDKHNHSLDDYIRGKEYLKRAADLGDPDAISYVLNVLDEKISGKDMKRYVELKNKNREEYERLKTECFDKKTKKYYLKPVAIPSEIRAEVEKYLIGDYRNDEIWVKIRSQAENL